MTTQVRHVCCGYYDEIRKIEVPCPNPEEIEKNSHKMAGDTHAPCEDCLKKAMENIDSL